MRELARDVWMLDGLPPNAINVYLVGDVLIDAGTRRAERRIVRQVSSRRLSAHALTHAHPTHQGASHAVCERFGIPLWCGRQDIPAMEGPEEAANPGGPRWLSALAGGWWTGPAHPVARALDEGDEVAGFEVLETPGHSRGHCAFWRESDGVLIVGDVLRNVSYLTGRARLGVAPEMLTADPARNRESARRLAGLRPSLACFGHGPPLRDPQRLAEFVAGLPAG